MKAIPTARAALLATLWLAAISSQFSRAFAQGNLTPPGAPAPTMKTLAQIEPRFLITNLPVTLNSSGSYYVAGNLSGVSGSNGITILAANVTVDLGGFALLGAGGTGDGILLSSNANNVCVRNGTLTGWFRGANAYDHSADSVRFEALRVVNNAGGGLGCGPHAAVSRCTAANNSGWGILSRAGASITGSLVASNSGTGISVGDNSQVMDSVVRNNNGGGIQVVGNGATVKHCTATVNAVAGISVGFGSGVLDCTAQFNTGYGIAAENGCTVSHCTARQNSNDGILVGASSVVSDCSASVNSANGIRSTGASTLRGCTANGNTTNGLDVASGSTVMACTASVNGADGVRTDDGSSVKDTTATQNGGNGIVGGFGCTLAGNTARQNRLDGLKFSSSCRVTDNVCDSNGNGGDGAGLHATGQAARIENNHCLANDRGIDVDGDRNVIIRNTCGFNTIDYDIVANNKVGVIFPALNSNAVSGSNGQGATAIGTSDPWANLSF